jgi:predicted nucleic acid-binding Zn ribbon protein
MRRKETQKISDIIKEVTRNTDLGAKLQETRLMESWGQLLGPMIMNSTRKIFISNRILFVYIESPVIRHELFMMRTRLQEALNQNVGENVIDNIIFR